MNPQTTTTTTTRDTPVNEKDSPAVLAYRVGQLETSVKEGIGQLNEKLDSIILTFASKDHLLLLEKRVNKIESKDGLKQTVIWVALASSVILNIVSAAEKFGG